jgi:hypothetical protein
MGMSGAERVRKHREKKRREQQCAWDGCHGLSGPEYYCAAHKAARRLYERQRRIARRQAEAIQ